MVLWLMVCLSRLMFYSSSYRDTYPWLGTLLNVLLVVGILLMVAIVARGLFGRAAATIHPDTRCRYCYAKVSADDEFCPVCGADIPKDERFAGSF